MSSWETSSSQSSARRLAAILCADIVSYSRLMGVDEEGTHQRVKRLRREIVDPTISEHHGRVIKNTGDGFLAMFDSPLEAVRSALVIQESMEVRNSTFPENQWIQYRIGVNLGDVIVDPDDIFGDGVNIAARLQSLAEPGTVYISGGVYEQIKNKLVCGYQSLGDEKLKNITDPIRIYRVLPDPAAVDRAQRGKRVNWIALSAVAGGIVLGGILGGWYALRGTDSSRADQTLELPAPQRQAAVVPPAAVPPTPAELPRTPPLPQPSSTAPAPTPPPTPAPAATPSEPSRGPQLAAKQSEPVTRRPEPPAATPSPPPPAAPAPAPQAIAPAPSPPAVTPPPPTAQPEPRRPEPTARSEPPKPPEPPKPEPAKPPEPRAEPAKPPEPRAQPTPPPAAPPPPQVAVVSPPRTSPAPPATSGQEVFRDCERCPEMVRLPGGSFSMGSNDDPSEKPVRRVTVPPFAIGRFPVTNGEWRQCVADKGCKYEPTGEDDRPVYNVSWDDAQQYVQWLSKVLQQKYRLPSEAEWEYAARAETLTKYWWGDKPVPGMANCKGCSDPYDAQKPLKVASFAVNPFGLYDMGGSVAQWVADCWHKNYQGAPSSAQPWDTPNCRTRVLRGGSWRHDVKDVRAASREPYDASVRYLTHGFRVARSP